jgi:rhodanese-related sulfurtransferase
MPEPKEIGIDALKAGLEDGSMVVVDVREAIEYDAGHIPGSLFNPLSAFDVSLLPKDKTVILSCRSGNRSKTAFAMAQAGGRADVDTHFAPGFLGWVAAKEAIGH